MSHVSIKWVYNIWHTTLFVGIRKVKAVEGFKYWTLDPILSPRANSRKLRILFKTTLQKTYLP